MYAKKSLGQHFLRSSHYINLIADTGNIVSGETIVEIGPGDGALTEELLKRDSRVVAIEKDSHFMILLKEKFSKEIKEKKLYLFDEDILNFEFSKGLLPKEYKVISNIPYYITGLLIRKFLTIEHQPSCIVFLIQKEVAERIARSNKESLLSLSVKAYGYPHFIKKVPSGAFSPRPNVDSAILKINNISRDSFENSKHELFFFEVLHAGFGKKRKLLKKNLEDVFGLKLDNTFAQHAIEPKARAEDLKVEKWIELTRAGSFQ